MGLSGSVAMGAAPLYPSAEDLPDNARPVLAPWVQQDCAERVLAFIPIKEQVAAVSSLSAGLCRWLHVEDPFSRCWLNLVMNLVAESKLYLPDSSKEQALIIRDGGWLGLFRELWPLRTRFCAVDLGNASSADTTEERFKLATFCRLRPASGRVDTSPQGAAVSLPLHQRLQLLRQSHPELSAQETMRKAMEAGRKPRNGSDTDQGEAAALTKWAFRASILSVQPGQDGSVLTVSPGCGLRNFQFGHVFDATAPQQDVYERCGLRLVSDLANGVNGALIVYGQTGSGKTHTMFGPPPGEIAGEESSAGLATRVADAVLVAADQRRGTGLNVQLGVSYVEIFGNDIRNLLQDQALAQHSAENARMGHRYVLTGLFEVRVESREELLNALATGETRKRKAATAMNERSTRAHTVLVLRLIQRSTELQAPVESTLFLADLGGSEKVSKSRANEGVKAPGGFVTNNEEVARVTWREYYRCRERITETGYINAGLLSLKRCIEALNRRRQCVQNGKPLPCVPFRESKLTAVLEPALGGLSRTAVIVCCSQEDRHAEETVQSLRFGELCGRVEHVRRGVTCPSTAIAQALKSIDDEVADVEAIIRQKERWEWRKKTRTDVVGDVSEAATTRVLTSEEMELGGFGAVEILPDQGDAVKEQVEHEVWGQVLVGAEEERERLESLLDRRRQLLGEA